MDDISAAAFPPVFLDYAATTPVAPEALEAMWPWFTDQFHNPASDHADGRRAARAVEVARASVATMFNARPDEVLFTSGATEATNLALKGAVEFRASPTERVHIVTARTEHKATVDTVRWLETRGHRATWLVPGADGRVSPQQVFDALTPETLIVSLMWVNNETGVVQDIETIARELRARGVLFHTDATQAPAWLGFDWASVPVDLMSISAHKIYGPKGVGALYVRKKPRARLAPQAHGGGHQQGMRSGTLPVPLIVAFGEAARLAAARRDMDAKRATALRVVFEARVHALSGSVPNGMLAPRSAHVSSTSFAGVDGEALRAGLPEIALSSGSACSSATREPSYVLRALGRDDQLAGATLRFSLGRATTAADLARAADRLAETLAWLRALAEGLPAASALTTPAAGAPNGYEYPPEVWQRFTSLAPTPWSSAIHGTVVSSEPATGPATTSTGWRLARVDSPAMQGARLEIAIGPDGERQFRVLGCPAVLAAASWALEWLAGRSSTSSPDASSLPGPTPAEIARMLDLPETRWHAATMAALVLKTLAVPLTTSGTRPGRGLATPEPHTVVAV